MRFAVIDFTDVAKQYCAFDSWNIRIYIYDEKEIISKLDFNPHNLERVKDMEIPIIWRLDTSSCEEIPKNMLFLGRLKVR